MSLASEVKVTNSDRRAAAETKARIEEKMRRLREVAPSVLDLSVREPTLPAPYGHTLEDKKQLFRLARKFGFQDIAVSTFADYPTVDVQFIRHLREQHADMNGLFSFCSPVQTEEGRPFKPNYGMERIAECSIPNVIFDLEIRPRTLARLGRSYETCLRDIEMSIAYMRQSLPEETLRRGRIYPNLADLFDAFEEDSEFVVRVLKLLEALPISAVVRHERPVFLLLACADRGGQAVQAELRHGTHCRVQHSKRHLRLGDSPADACAAWPLLRNLSSRHRDEHRLHASVAA